MINMTDKTDTIDYDSDMKPISSFFSAQNMTEKELPVVKTMPEERKCVHCGRMMTAIEDKHLVLNKENKKFMYRIDWKYECPNDCDKKIAQAVDYAKNYWKAKKIWENSGLSRECIGWTLDKLTCENIDYLKFYAETFNRYSKALVLKGYKGTGKSLSSECIAKKLIKKGFKVKITNMTEINIGMNQALLKGKFKDYIDTLLRYDLLIIDDFGREQYTTEKSLENVFYFFNTLTKNHKPFILSVNPEMLSLVAEKPQLDACLDRFKKSERVEILTFKNESFRR